MSTKFEVNNVSVSTLLGYVKDGSESEGKQILIDGQQRITALTAALLGQQVLNSSYKKEKSGIGVAI